MKTLFERNTLTEDMLTFESATHSFYLNGKQQRLPGVTSVLESSGVITEYCKSAIAANFGTAVHEMVRLDILHQLDTPELSPGLVNPYAAWKMFCEDAPHLRVLVDRVEKPTFHPVYMYAGIPDLPMYDERDGCHVIIDIKTANCDYEPHWELQTSAYEGCLRHWLKLRPLDWVCRKILLLSDKTQDYKLVALEDTSAWPAWIGMLNAYKWKLANGYIKATNGGDK